MCESWHLTSVLQQGRYNYVGSIFCKYQNSRQCLPQYCCNNLTSLLKGIAWKRFVRQAYCTTILRLSIPLHHSCVILHWGWPPSKCSIADDSEVFMLHMSVAFITISTLASHSGNLVSVSVSIALFPVHQVMSSSESIVHIYCSTRFTKFTQLDVVTSQFVMFIPCALCMWIENGTGFRHVRVPYVSPTLVPRPYFYNLLWFYGS